MTQFNLSTVGFSWLPIMPPLAVALGAIVVMLVGVRVDDEDSADLGFIALVALLAAFILTLFTFGQNVTAFNGSLVIDNFAGFFELLIEVAAALTVAMSLEYVADAGLGGAEYYALLLFGVFGMMLLAAAGDLIAIFLGFETMSIAVYALAGFVRRDPKSNEAALKYFLLGAFSTGFLLYGIALVYGAMGTIRLEAIRAALGSGIGANPLLLPGIGLILIGFGFKVAAVPFHMWTPDAYEGAPTPITGFMAVGVKVAAFAGFMRIFMVGFGPISAQWSMVLWVIAAITMTTGNVIALVQNNIKRMLAYSAIAHAGYILVGMAAAGGPAGAAILYYLLGYAFTNLGAFAIVIAVEQGERARDDISDFRGLARSHPGLAAAMSLFLLSLVGVPPLAGFVGKFYVFSAALNQGLVALVIIAAINSVISAYYYIRVIVAMYMQEGEARPPARTSAHPGLLISIAAAVLAVIAIGVYPQPYMGAAVNAYASAVSRTLLHATASAR